MPDPDAPPYPLLFLDIDGTLVGHNEIPSPRTVAALRAAHDIGCTIVICTGRHRHTVGPIVEHWGGGKHSYGAYCNGAVLVDLTTGETIHKIALPTPTVEKAGRLARSFGLAPLYYGVHVEEDAGRVVYTDALSQIYPAFSDRYGYRLAALESTEVPAPVDMGVFGTEESIRALAAAWRRELGPDVIVYDCAEPRIDADCWAAFLNNRAADKSHAAQFVANMLGVPREQTFAVGDQLNDLGLLRWAGLGVCMGDGHAEARGCADFVTATFAEDGAAQAIERFVLRIENGGNNP